MIHIEDSVYCAEDKKFKLVLILKIISMKKLFVTLVFLAVSLISNARFFVAGSISAYHVGGETSYKAPFHTVDKAPIQNGFTITPAVGYMIPGKSYGFGLGLGYGYASLKDNDYTLSNGDVIVENVKKGFSNTFDFGPFFRYAYARFDKITLYVDAKIPVSISSDKTKIGDAVVIDGDKTFSIGARLIPGLTYRFNNHILFTTEIGLLSINCMHTRMTSPSGTVNKTNEFKLGANTRQTAAFGFVYLF